MKRCPECHFTFEDRVQVCDFDGSELTSFADPAPLSDRIVGPSTKSNLIRFANSRIALAGLVLLVLVPGVVLIVRHKSSSPPVLEEKVVTAERHDSIISTARTRKSRRRRRSPVHRSSQSSELDTTPSHNRQILDTTPSFDSSPHHCAREIFAYRSQQTNGRAV